MTCTIPNCNRPLLCKGVCRYHYGQGLGKPPCSVQDCTIGTFSKGLCRRHYFIAWKHGGDPLWTAPPRAPKPPKPPPRPPSTSYQAVHKQITKARGKATDQLCPCGAPARQWAYQHNDPDQLSMVDKRDGRTYTYSLDPANYVAMCQPCHTKFDYPTNRPARRTPVGVSRSWPSGSAGRPWMRIRNKVLERDGNLCQLRIPGKCTIYATQVHHTEDRLVVGDDPAYLVAACRRCNNQIGDVTKPRASTRKLFEQQAHTIVVDPYTL